MSNSITIPRGTADILPSEIARWHILEFQARRVMELYGYREIRTPAFEDVHLFKRSLGVTSDVVNKQLMELSADKAGFALRPEGTASIVRSYIENHFDKKESLSKFYYIGAMFRGERPQKGRLRQFHQIGAEAIGPTSSHPLLDAEMIALAMEILDAAGIKGSVLKINSLGTPEDKEAFSQLLRKQLAAQTSGLCEDCQNRFERNVFRILDCKTEACRKIVKSLNLSIEHLSQDSQKYFQSVQEALRTLKIDFQVAPTLVRGLDYYTHTVFEISNAALGSQDALGAGGRYNRLAADLGGSENVEAIGFALGMERMLLAMPTSTEEISEPIQTIVIALSRDDQPLGFEIVSTLRRAGISGDMGYQKASMKSQMRLADKLGAQTVILIGEDERKNGYVTVKRMADGTQEKVPVKDHFKTLVDYFKK